MIIKLALYGFKSSGAAFWSKLEGVIHDIHNKPTKADPYVLIQPAINTDGTLYYEMVLCYVNEVLFLSHAPMQTIYEINVIFKLKDDKAEESEMYLGASFQKVRTVGYTACWAIYLEK